MSIRILQIVPSLSLANGVAAYLENYYRFMDVTNFNTTILVLNDDDKGRYEFFRSIGCEIIEIFRENSWNEYFKKIDLFFQLNKFDIVHCHVANYGAFYMYYAKKYNIPFRILHSHANRSADKFIRAIRNNMLIPFAVMNSNYYVACSKDAGKFMFNKRKFDIFNNGIDYLKYSFNDNVRNDYRNKYKLNDKFVIGTFGRLCNQKNQLFTLDIFQSLLLLVPNSYLIMIGSGELEKAIKNKVKQMHLENNVLILPSRNDLDKFYNSLDAFLLPSTYEGLGIVLIEAQINGLHTYTSKHLVPEEAKISNLLEFVELNNNPDEWAKKIYENKDDIRSKKNEYNLTYNISNSAKKLEMYYKTILKSR